LKPAAKKSSKPTMEYVETCGEKVVETCGEIRLKNKHPNIKLYSKGVDIRMLKVYICSKCGSYRFVTNNNYTCYKCQRHMTLADIEYANYIELDSSERDSIRKKYIKY